MDDRHDRRQLMKYVIELSGPDVSVVGFAESGPSAVETVERLEADIVVVEIQIPVVQGLAAIAALRGAHPGLRIIVCSFHDDPATKQAALDGGADAYLTKPLSPRELSAAFNAPQKIVLPSPTA
jgi:DNA-binding NarL/FixJ family response regulator